MARTGRPLIARPRWKLVPRGRLSLLVVPPADSQNPMCHTPCILGQLRIDHAKEASACWTKWTVVVDVPPGRAWASYLLWRRPSARYRCFAVWVRTPRGTLPPRSNAAQHVDAVRPIRGRSRANSGSYVRNSARRLSPLDPARFCIRPAHPNTLLTITWSESQSLTAQPGSRG